MLRLRFALPALILSCFSVSAHAESDSQDVKMRAAQLMMDVEFQQSCDLLEKHFDFKTSQDTDVLYMRGQCLQGQSLHAQAIPHYQRILEINPKAKAVRLPLANAYYLSGQKEMAKKNLDIVLEDFPNSSVANNVNTAMRAVKTNKPWFVGTEFGLIYDSNTSAGPDDPQITILGLPFTLDTASQQQDSVGVMARVSGGYRHILNANTALVSQMSYSVTDYVESSLFDSQTLTASVGPLYQKGSWILSGNINTSWRALDRETYSRGIGVNGRAAYQIDNKTSANVAVGVTDNNYVADSRDGVSSYAVVGVSRNVTQKAIVDLNYTVSQDLVTDARYENVKHGPSAGARIKLRDDLIGGLNLSYNYADYEGEDVFFNNEVREDNIYSASANLSYDLGKHVNVDQLALNLRGTYTRADSNLEIYDYERETITISVSKSW